MSGPIVLRLSRLEGQALVDAAADRLERLLIREPFPAAEASALAGAADRLYDLLGYGAPGAGGGS